MTDLADLITTVRQEAAALRKRIEKQESILRDLEQQLKTHERIATMLQGDTTAPKTTRRPARKKTVKAAKKSRATKKAVRRKRASRTNWNTVLEGLPPSFTAGQVKEVVGDTSNYADVQQALLRWRKAERVTTSGRGQYKKT